MRKGSMNMTTEFWMVAVAIIFTIMVLIIGYNIFFEKIWYGDCWADAKKNLTFMREGDNYFEFGDCIKKVVFTGKKVYQLEDNCKYTKPKDGESYASLVVMYPKEKGGIAGAFETGTRWFTDTWNTFQESHQDIVCILHDDILVGDNDIVLDDQNTQNCVYLQKPTPESEYMSIGECEIGGNMPVNPNKDFLKRCWDTLISKIESTTDGRNEIQFGTCVSEVIFSSSRSVSSYECSAGESKSYVYIIPSIAAQEIGKKMECIGMDFAIKSDVTIEGLGKTSCINVKDQTDGKTITVC